MVRKIGWAVLFAVYLGCSREIPEEDYRFTQQYMLLPVAFTVNDERVGPDETWCHRIEALELCIYTEGHTIRIGFTNLSEDDSYLIQWRRAVYVDENGNEHRLEMFPPDIQAAERVLPRQHRWLSFVPEGKRSLVQRFGEPDYFHVEWLVPWNEDELSENEAQQTVQAIYDSSREILIRLPVLLPDGAEVVSTATMKLLAMRKDEFLHRYGAAKYDAWKRTSAEEGGAFVTERPTSVSEEGRATVQK